MDTRPIGEAEMSSSIREWLNLSLRWFHVFAGIMWVGQTYYFTWLDGQFGKIEKRAAADGTAPAVWMVHSGGFYTVEKQKSLGVAPEQVRWFRWEALMTWLAGVVLLALVYYVGDGLIDPDVADISKQAGIAIGVAAMVGGWIIYDLAARSPLGKSLGAQAKLRSKHNTFMAVPVVFLMLSSHYPVATYGSRYGWEIMLALIVAGMGAAKLIREF